MNELTKYLRAVSPDLPLAASAKGWWVHRGWRGMVPEWGRPAVRNIYRWRPF
jgi:hypothetical protein